MSIEDLKAYAQEMHWMQKIRQLEAAYTTEGREALAKMRGIEAYVLYEEKYVALAAAELMLKETPEHRRWMLRRDRLKAEVGDIEGWLKEKVAPFNQRERGKGRER